MFENAELGHKIEKEIYQKEVPKLREALLEAQGEIVEAKKFPVIILIGGVDGAGKGETMNLLTEWMDPRHIQVNAMDTPTDEERERPPMWRFWRALPPAGKLGIFFGSWYTDPIVKRVLGETKNAHLDQSIEEIVRFEKMLTDEGALILKFWFHLSKKQQRKRLEALEADPKNRWRVTDRDWKGFALYSAFREVSERTLRQTSTADAQWTVVEGADARYRSLTVGTAVADAMKKRHTQGNRVSRPTRTGPDTPAVDDLNVLKRLDLSLSLEKEDFDKQLDKLQRRLNLLSRHPKFKDLGVVAVFEGADAAGKGGTIRRVTGSLDTRFCRVVPIAAPTEEERAQPYLWRFWRHIPRRGRVTIFDRSWYGRVLVERVEGFCSEPDWRRAYNEINDFEEQLSRYGIVVMKFWLHISKDEQLKRFKDREKTSFKRFKITDEDWRNREKWPAYESAICEMVERTSTEIAPWTLVEANDKYYARIKTLKTFCDRIEAAL